MRGEKACGECEKGSHVESARREGVSGARACGALTKAGRDGVWGLQTEAGQGMPAAELERMAAEAKETLAAATAESKGALDALFPRRTERFGEAILRVCRVGSCADGVKGEAAHGAVLLPSSQVRALEAARARTAPSLLTHPTPYPPARARCTGS